MSGARTGLAKNTKQVFDQSRHRETRVHLASTSTAARVGCHAWQPPVHIQSATDGPTCQMRRTKKSSGKESRGLDQAGRRNRPDRTARERWMRRKAGVFA